MLGLMPHRSRSVQPCRFSFSPRGLTFALPARDPPYRVHRSNHVLIAAKDENTHSL
jgi:hypothetical protein